MSLQKLLQLVVHINIDQFDYLFEVASLHCLLPRLWFFFESEMRHFIGKYVIDKGWAAVSVRMFLYELWKQIECAITLDR